MFRALGIVAFAILAPSAAVAAERSFTLEGNTFYLDFPAEFRFVERGKHERSDGEFVKFLGCNVEISFHSFPVREGDTDFDTELYLKEQSEDGAFYIKAFAASGVSVWGGCGNDDGGYCFYFAQRLVPGAEKKLWAGVSCWNCSDETMREAGILIEHIGDQLRE